MREPGAGSRTVLGVTLIELVVALAILGTTLGVAGLALRSLAPTVESEALHALEAARRQAIESGVSTTVSRDGRAVRFAPDGSAAGGPIVTDSLVLFVDPLTGAVHAAAR
jgi:prepilin-type N-terminal cleavage/methylation domain-containing protein